MYRNVPLHVDPENIPMKQSQKDSGIKSRSKLPSGRHGLPRDVVVSSQRERMVEAMIQVVAEQGFAGTTVADIISTAGVSRATFYEQFADKEDCFLAAYATVMDRMLAFVAEGFAADDSGDWIERLRGGIRSLLRYLAQNPVAVRVGIVEGFGAGARARDRYQQAVSAFFPFLDAGRELIDSPERVPGETSRVIVGGISALIFNEASAGNSKHLPQLLPPHLAPLHRKCRR
jgi:AcrR family transcriptional regulator